MSGREGDSLHGMLGHIKGRSYFLCCLWEGMVGDGCWVMDADMVGE